MKLVTDYNIIMDKMFETTFEVKTTTSGTTSRVNPIPTSLPEYFPTLINESILHVTPGTLTTVSNLCYEMVPGLHSLEQIQELTSHPVSEPYLRKLQHSIPSDWRRAIQTQNSSPNSRNQLKINVKAGKNTVSCSVHKINTRTFYHTLQKYSTTSLAREKVTSHFYTDWGRKTGPVRWHRVFCAMYKNHSNKQITDVQYKLIHFGLITHKHLFYKHSKVMNQTSPLCTRCQMMEEDGEHIFVGCSHYTSVWREARRLLNTIIRNFTENNYKLIVTGFADTKLPQKYQAIAEDIRICYFQEIWITRNKSLYDNDNSDALPVFRR